MVSLRGGTASAQLQRSSIPEQRTYAEGAPARRIDSRSKATTEFLIKDGAWKLFNEMSSPQEYPHSVELFRQGSVPREVYYLERGMIKLSFSSVDGQEVIIDLCFPGQILESASAILQEHHLVTATAVSRCRIRKIPAERFLNALNIDVKLSWQIHQMHSREIRNRLVNIAGLACLSARHRLEQMLWKMISSVELLERKKPIRLHSPLKQLEIAQLIAVTPQHLSGLFKHLEQDGVLHREKGALIIPDPMALWHESEI